MLDGSGGHRTIATYLVAKDKASGTLSDVEESGDRTRDSMSAAEEQGKQLTRTFAVLGGAATALSASLVYLTKRHSQTEQRMATLREVTNATDQEFQQLQKTTSSLGQELPVSMAQASAGVESLVFSGLELEQALAAADDVAELASVSMLGMGEAARSVSSAIRAFGYDAEEASAVVSTMTSVFATSATRISELSQAVKRASASAQIADVSFEELSASIGLMASQAGIRASRAGTALNTMLTRISTGSRQASGALERLGLSLEALTNEQGGLRDLPVVLTMISERLDQLSDTERRKVLADLGGQRGLRALQPLLDNTSELNNRIGDVFQTQVKDSIAALSDLSDEELGEVATDLGVEEIDTDEFSAADLVMRLEEMNARGATTEEMAEQLGDALNISGDAATYLAEGVADADVSNQALQESIGDTTTAAELSAAKMNTASGAMQFFRSSVEAFTYSIQTGTQPAMIAVNKRLGNLINLVNSNRKVGAALGAVMVGAAGATTLAATAVGVLAVNLKLAQLQNGRLIQTTATYNALTKASTAATLAKNKAMWLATASTSQLIAATRAKSASLFTSITALGSNTAATLANASAKGILAGAASAAIAPALALNAALGPIGLIALAAAGGLAALTAIAGGDLLGAGDEAAAVLGLFGEKAETAYLAGSQLLGILYEVGRIGATLGGLALVAPFAGLLKLPEVPGMIRSMIPEAKAAAAQLPTQVIAGLNSIGPARYALPVVGPLLGLHSLITGVGPEAKQAAAQIPAQVVAGLNSMGPAQYALPVIGPMLAIRDGIDRFGPEAKQAAAQIPARVVAGLNSTVPSRYTLPILGPLLGLHDLITGVGPEAKEAAAQLPAQVIAGLDSMDRARYLAPVIGPLMSLQNPISGVGQEAKQAAAQLPAQVITGLDSLGPAQYALPVIGPMLAIRDGIDRFGPEVKEAAAQLPTQVIAGLNSMAPTRYTLPILSPLLGLYDLITGVGPEAKEAAAQLPVQVIAGLNSMGPAQYLIPILGPVLAARDALTNPDEWVSAGQRIPMMLAEGIGQAASAPVDEIAGITGQIGEYLPSSDAERGEFRTLSERGPTVVDMLATGIESEAPVLTSTLENVFSASSLGMAAGTGSAVVAGQSIARGGSDRSSSRRPARSRQDEPRINITLEQTNEFGATTDSDTIRRDVQKATRTGGRDALGELELLLRQTLSEADQ